MFDADAFSKAQPTLRTAKVRIDGLAAFFTDEEPVFVVRQLTGPELARVDEAARRNRDVAELISHVMAGEPAERVESALSLLGYSTQRVPDDLARWIESIHLGLVYPELTRDQVIKLVENFGVDAKVLAFRIAGLSGQGAILGELNDSGTSQPSESRAA